MIPAMQQRVTEFIDTHALDAPVSHRLLDLTSEIGELSKEFLKATEYGSRAVHAHGVSEHWAEEIGDVFFALICVANATGVDLEQSLMNALDKYQRRLGTHQSPGSGP